MILFIMEKLLYSNIKSHNILTQIKFICIVKKAYFDFDRGNTFGCCYNLRNYYNLNDVWCYTGTIKPNQILN
jgi:hypothetical protein